MAPTLQHLGLPGQDALCRAERALLGAAMMDEMDLARFLVSCVPDDFGGDGRHRAIARAIVSLSGEGTVVTYCTVAERLEAHGTSVGRGYLRQCLGDACRDVVPCLDRLVEAAIDAYARAWLEEVSHGVAA